MRVALEDEHILRIERIVQERRQTIEGAEGRDRADFNGIFSPKLRGASLCIDMDYASLGLGEKNTKGRSLSRSPLTWVGGLRPLGEGT